MKLRSLLVLTALLATACSKDAPPSAAAFPQEKVAAADVNASLAPAGFTETKDALVTIQKAALGKIFLLTMTMTDSEPAATRNTLLPKVVSFHSNGTDIALMEENIYSVYSELPNAKLLQSFPIVKQDDNTVTFKWNYGLASVPAKDSMATSDQPDSFKEQVGAADPTLPVVASFLSIPPTIKNNRLEMRQVARVKSVEGVLPEDESDKKVATNVTESSVQVDIAIAPYVPNPTFKMRKSTELEGVGFFEVANLRKSEGNVDIFATRWDLSPEKGPITYDISKNTPADAVDAIKEGVLYWNSISQAVLHRDIVQVQTGVDPEAIQPPRHVMIYWVPYYQAGRAYANIQPDPLTGEITNGLVYQTSVFFLSGQESGRRIVNRGVETAPTKPNSVMPVGFRTGRVCEFPQPNNLFDPLIEKLDEKIAKRIGHDYLRSTVAHEVGHTLGLRHNFAGSFASELKEPSDNREAFRRYLADEQGGALTSSSIMEYTTFRDDLLLSAAIQAKKLPAYDQEAIRWGYSDQEIPADQIHAPPFCTDTEAYAGKVLGCSTTDTSPHPVAGHAATLERTRLNATDTMYEAFLDGLRPRMAQDKLTIKEIMVKNTPEEILKNLLGDAPNIVRLGGKDMKVITIDREESGSNWFNKDEYKDKTQAYIKQEFAHAGGLPGIMQTAMGLDETYHFPRGWFQARAQAKINAPDFGRGKDITGAAYQFTPNESAQVKAGFLRMAAAVEDAYLTQLIEMFTGSGPVTDPAKILSTEKSKTYDPAVATDDWAPKLAAFGEQMILQTSDAQVSGTVGGKPVAVPQPAFNMLTRLAAVRLFAPKIFGREPGQWNQLANQSTVSALEERLAPVATFTDHDPAKVKFADGVSPELKAWADKEVALAVALKSFAGPDAKADAKGGDQKQGE